MIFSNERFYNEPKILTKEEMEEARYQERILGVRLADRKFYCDQKMADGFKNFFQGREKFGKCGTDADSKYYIQIISLNLELKSKFAALSSNSVFHKFLADCYAKVVDIHAKRLEAVAARVKFDQDSGKFREKTLEIVGKNLSEKRADQELVQSQKTKRPQPAFDKENFKTWSSLNAENAERSKNRLVEKKTNLLEKTSKHDQDISSLESEREPFDQKITNLQAEINGDLSEAEFKDTKLSLEYYELKIKKIEVKIEKIKQEKSDAQAELDEIEKKIAVLNCCIDRYNLLHESKNFEDRKNRVAMRVEKVLKEREELCTMRNNLNKLWLTLTTDESPKKEARAVSPYRQDTPVKEEELCEPLTLKASAKIYFI